MKEMFELLAALGLVAVLMIIASGIVGASFKFWIDLLSDGDFSRQIEGNLQNIKGRGTTDADYRLFFGELPGRYEIVNRFSMLLYEHEIEAIQEYNPKDWNNYPDVTPPEGVLMRVEFVYDGILRRNCAIFENGAWYIAADRKALYDFTIDNVKRYRPWE